MARSRSPELVEYADLIRFRDHGYLSQGQRGSAAAGDDDRDAARPVGWRDRTFTGDAILPLALDRAWEYFCARAGVDAL
jgi:hypothetical protein